MTDEEMAEEWVKEQFPNDEFLQSAISRKLLEFSEKAYRKDYTKGCGDGYKVGFTNALKNEIE